MDPEEKSQKVFQVLDTLGIKFEVFNHPPLATVEEAKNYWSEIRGIKAKNLFLRDQKGKKHYLVILEQDKAISMKAFSEQFGLDKLSFASEDRLKRFLGLVPGAVSPFGLINDTQSEVIVYIDQDVFSDDYVNFHPNINTMTVNLSNDDFKKYLSAIGNLYYIINVSNE